jgi:RNA polymerase sigma-70 factor (ECF subfamily)
MRKITAQPSVLVFLKKFKTEVLKMKTINLRDYYPYYQSDFFLNVEDEIALALKRFDLLEEAYRIRRYRYKAYYSLDRGDGIERDFLFIPFSSCEIYEHKVTRQQLYTAIASLPGKQAKRIYAHYFMGMTKYAIARAEGVDERAIRKSIERGLRRLERLLKDL